MNPKRLKKLAKLLHDCYYQSAQWPHDLGATDNWDNKADAVRDHYRRYAELFMKRQ